MATANHNGEQPPTPTVGYESLDDYRSQRCLIGIEEHIAVPMGFPLRPSTQHLADTFKFLPDFLKDVNRRLVDVDLRLAHMDKCGVAAQILSHAEPNCQSFRTDELEQSVKFARAANQYLFDTYVTPHPTRFFGFATVPTQDGKAAAAELERCVKEYGFKGCLINGYVTGPSPRENLYLSSPNLEPFWAKVAELDVPVFLHPRHPSPDFFPIGDDLPALTAPAYGYTRETAEHALRIMCSGIFDKFPKIRVVLGHLGESLTFMLPRTDHRFRINTQGSHGAHKKQLRHYLQNNFLILPSGHFTTTSLQQVIAETSTNTVLYGDDYPYESIEEHTAWWKTIPVGAETWKDMSYRNAIKYFKLPLNFDKEEK